MEREETLKTLLSSAVFLLIFFFFFRAEALLWLALVVLSVGFFENTLNAQARLIVRLWLGFSELLGKISSFILLFAVFYFVVAPMAFFWRLFNRESAGRFFLNSGKSLFSKVERDFSKEYFEKTW